MWYYMASGGAVYTGWKKLGGKWYYFLEDENTARVSISTSKRTIFYGMMIAGRTMTIDGKCYCFNSEGEMVTGWRMLNGIKWHYFSTDTKDYGQMLYNCKKKIGVKTYIFDKEGNCTNFK